MWTAFGGILNLLSNLPHVNRIWRYFKPSVKLVAWEPHFKPFYLVLYWLKNREKAKGDSFNWYFPVILSLKWLLEQQPVTAAAAAALLNPSLLKQGQKGVKMRTMLQDDDKFLEKELTTPLPPPKSVKSRKSRSLKGKKCENCRLSRGTRPPNLPSRSNPSPSLPVFFFFKFLEILLREKFKSPPFRDQLTEYFHMKPTFFSSPFHFKGKSKDMAGIRRCEPLGTSKAFLVQFCKCIQSWSERISFAWILQQLNGGLF